MTTTETDPARLRAAARDHYRQALATSTAPSGAELGRRFGMSARWGSARAREANQHPTGTPANSTGTHTLADAMPIGTAGHAVPVDGMPPDTRCGPAHAAERFDLPTVVPVGTDSAGRRVRVIIRWVTTLAVIVVAACAARASYDHQRRFVEMAGETEAAWYLPLSVDGMMLVASLNMLVRRWDDQPAGWLIWCALLIGGLASLAANIAAAEPTAVGRAVAAWPPICLLVSYELLMQQLPTRPAPAPHPQAPAGEPPNTEPAPPVELAA